MTNLILLDLVAYLAGSVNFSIILFKVLGRGDPRSKFSGNAGAVNVTRQLGKVWGGVILSLDIARAGAIALVGSGFCLPPLCLCSVFSWCLGTKGPCFTTSEAVKGWPVISALPLLFPRPRLEYLAWSGFLPTGYSASLFIGSFFMITALGMGTVLHYHGSWPVYTGAGLTMALIFLVHKTNIIAYGKRHQHRDQDERDDLDTA